MKKLTVEAAAENISKVTEFVNEQLGENECPAKIKAQIDIAVDEIFGNISNYAYGSKSGNVSVCVETVREPSSDKQAVITFADSGLQYDPLSAKDPDITLSADKREIGGLGVYLVKNIMDSVSYEYRDGQNILQITKKY